MKHLILKKIMININIDLLQWSINLLIKRVLLDPLRLQINLQLKHENISNKELAEELHMPIIRKFKRREVQSTFIDNIWGADPADMQLRCKFNKGFTFLLCVIDFSVNTHGLFLCKIKEVLQLLMVFKKV